MIRKSKPRQWVGRALPLRNETIPYKPIAASVLSNHIWFTPEVIVLDAVDFLVDIIWLWKTFKKILPISIFRIGVISLMILIVVGFNQDVTLSAASVSEKTTAIVETKLALEISTEIKAAENQTIGWPVPKTYISTYFSGWHKGIDIPNPYNRSVKPFTSGTVVFVGWDGGFGKLVQISHKDGYLTKYAHLSNISVRRGQKVGPSTIIGQVGSTGYATGSHLHFEVLKNGYAMNPLVVLP